MNRRNFDRASKVAIIKRATLSSLSCVAAECEAPGRARCEAGVVCAVHYRRWRVNGSFDLPTRRGSPNGICMADECGMLTRSTGSPYCEAHYYRLRRSSKNGLSPIALYCACGEELQGNQSRFCSEICSRSYFSGLRAGNAAYQEKSRTRAHIRRLQKIGANSEEFSRAEIFERDNWRCGICGEKIAKSLKYPHRRSAVLDHITPLSKGGSHSRVNAQTAHLSCNAAKSAKLIGQLRLFG